MCIFNKILQMTAGAFEIKNHYIEIYQHIYNKKGKRKYWQM